tara:strand:- start:11 stop:307 length:297 start_codon:yes stop_codon:yes gene_type:complete
MSISYGWEWTIRDTNGELLESTPIGLLQSTCNNYPDKWGKEVGEIGLKLFIDYFSVDINEQYLNFNDKELDEVKDYFDRKIPKYIIKEWKEFLIEEQV